jgi:NDP-sugar pyrophosphorylase family protein
MVPIDPSASIDKAANILGATVIGKGATVGFGAFLENAIVWPGEHVAPGAKVVDAVVANGQISQASTGRD